MMLNDTPGSDAAATKTIGEQLKDLFTNAQPAPSNPRPISNAVGVQDALNYIDKVKLRFTDRPEVYEEFLSILADFRLQRLDAVGVTSRTVKLLEGHSDLIQGFNSFISPGLSIGAATQPQSTHGDEAVVPNDTLSSNNATTKTISEQFKNLSIDAPPAPSSPRPPLNTSNVRTAVDYINKVKSCLKDHPETYEEFLNTMGDFHHGRLDTPEVIKRVVRLLEGHPDLITDFGKFIPPGLSAKAPSEPPRADGDEEENNSGVSTNSELASLGNCQ